MPAIERTIRALCLPLVAVLLTACGGPVTPPSGPYARYLKGDESVRKVTQEGPFTLLDIEYRSCCGYLFGAQLDYQRILYRDKVIVKRTERAVPFHGFGRSALIWPIIVSDGDLTVVSERNGKAVFDKFNPGVYDYRGEEGFEYGYPIAPGVRYFPRNGGALVRGFPITVQPLPKGVDCCGVWIGELAGTAPDGTAYAYADRRDTPGAIIVVDADGQAREPVALPQAATIPDTKQDLSPYSPLLRWFGASFQWVRNAQGRWNVLPATPAPHAASAPLEDLFLDVTTGYRQCFATDNAACQAGWRRLREGELPGIFKDGFMPPYTYAPLQPARAFGAPVSALLFGRTGYGGPGYHLFVDDKPVNVIAAFTQRLRQRKLPFVRADECPREDDWPQCEDAYRKQLGWEDKLDYSLEDALHWRPEDGAMFMLPTLAVTISALEDGSTQVYTRARYPAPPPMRKN